MYSMWIKRLLLILLYITHADGHPVQDIKPDENCIKMSPDIQKQLDNIIEDITKHINAISTAYDDIDLRLLEISIDRHFSEENKKNTIVHITVNDCNNGVNQRQHDTDIEHDTKSVVMENMTNISNKSLENDNNFEDFHSVTNDGDDDIDFEDFDRETDDGDDSNRSKLDELNDEVISNVSPEENDFNEDDLFVDDINPENSRKTDTQTADSTVIDEFDVDFDDFYESKTNVTSEINTKNNIPVKLHFIDFNDIKNTKFDKEFKNIDSISEEINLIDDDDKLFFRAMEKSRGDGPFVIYERYVQDSVQYWFF